MKVQDVKHLSRKIMESGEIPLLWGHFGVGKTDLEGRGTDFVLEARLVAD
ncbi:MAG: MoxR-like ATPase [Mesotoga infera]|uniref:MoxR-like ATPase n=1 Tax=Mesotoga infera TaxID=1236046 RepID=A0A101HZF1_9BACT|nr:MAG: MoxR-like ATPase [Mesotoga infera]